MPDFPKLPIVTPPSNSNKFPELPIVTPDPPRLTLQEKYGNFYYAGIAGLIVTLALVGLFALGVWSTRDVGHAVYVLHNSNRTETERIQAAWTLARSPVVNDRQRHDIALRKDLPALARYVIAEGLTSDSITYDPKAYAEEVARSEGWPDWLRLLLSRPMAYGVGEGYRIAWEPLDLLRNHADPAIALWATYTRAVMAPGDRSAAKDLEAATGKAGSFQPLAILLFSASIAEGDLRLKKLDEATEWLRSHHPEAIKIWEGWEVKDGELVRSTHQKSPGEAPK